MVWRDDTGGLRPPPGPAIDHEQNEAAMIGSLKRKRNEREGALRMPSSQPELGSASDDEDDQENANGLSSSSRFRKIRRTVSEGIEGFSRLVMPRWGKSAAVKGKMREHGKDFLAPILNGKQEAAKSVPQRNGVTLETTKTPIHASLEKRSAGKPKPRTPITPRVPELEPQKANWKEVESSFKPGFLKRKRSEQDSNEVKQARVGIRSQFKKPRTVEATELPSKGKKPEDLARWDPHAIGRGIVNMGNTCFMNAVLQSMCHSRLFREALEEAFESHGQCDDPSHCSLCLLVSHVNEVFSTEKMQEPLRPNLALADCLPPVPSSLKGSSIRRQEDAHEYMRLFIDKLTIVETKGGKFSHIEKIFRGSLEVNCKCTVCGRDSITFEHFQDFSASLVSINGKDEMESIADVLNGFVSDEILDKANAYMCQDCQVPVRARRTTRPKILPELFVIHLKRFESHSKKITKHVKFDRELTIEKEGVADWILRAIIVHQGASCHSGHYYAYIHLPDGWFKFDDSRISKCTWKQVAREPAYMLLYEGPGADLLQQKGQCDEPLSMG